MGVLSHGDPYSRVAHQITVQIKRDTTMNDTNSDDTERTEYEAEVALTISGTVTVSGRSENDAREMAEFLLEDCHPFDELGLLPTDMEVCSLEPDD